MKHFADEEHYMASINFPGFDVLEFWLRAHISGVDRKYGAQGATVKV